MRAKIISLVFIVAASTMQGQAFAHQHLAPQRGTAHYLGNEGVLISTEFGKVLFDPFFHKDYGSYTLVPEEIRDAIFQGDAPYDKVNLIVVSHAHGDHFSAEDVLAYLKDHASTKLIAPAQAVDKIRALDGAVSVQKQLIPVSLNVGDAAVTTRVGRLFVESVHIPHASWPKRAEISNLVHRVTFGENLNVIHMGDADPNDLHFKPYIEHWQAVESEMAFPPYWFFTSQDGRKILSKRINAVESVGVHVPNDVPHDLIETGATFFSTPGEKKTFQSKF